MMAGAKESRGKDAPIYGAIGMAASLARLPLVGRNGDGASIEVEPWSVLKNLHKVDRTRGRHGVDELNALGVVHVSKTAMAESSGILGGYIVPTDYTTLLMETIAEESFVRPRARVIPMASKVTDCPRPYFEAAHSTGVSFAYAGIQFTWGENGSSSVSETEPSFAMNSLIAGSMIGDMFVSNQVMEDLTPEGEYDLMKLFSGAAAWYEEYAYFNGTGTDGSQPIGMINAPCRLTQNRQSPNQVNYVDIQGMVKQILPNSWPKAIWACSPTAFGQILGLTGYVPNANPSGAGIQAAGYLASRPVFVTEKLPALGTTGDLLFFDPSLYVIGDRMLATIAVSTQNKFQNNQSVVRMWRRCTGQPLLSKSVTLQDNATVCSSIVVLN